MDVQGAVLALSTFILPRTPPLDKRRKSPTEGDISVELLPLLRFK